MYDVAIIGAGPAGLATALSLKYRLEDECDNNISILLIDKEKVPGENKPCGGMILYQVLKHIPRLKEIASRKIRGVRIFYREKRYDIDFEDTVAINVDRARLARFFMDKIKKKINLVLGETVRKIKENSSGYILLTENRSYKTKILVGADGVNSLVRRMFFSEKVHRSDIGIAYQELYNISEIELESKFNGYNEFYYGKNLVQAVIPGFLRMITSLKWELGLWLRRLVAIYLFI